jgi:Glucodextranase, domain B/FecR protein
MANRHLNGANVDWYLVSIDRLKRIGLVLLLVLVAGGGWLAFHQLRLNPRKRAESEIANARAALNSLATSKDLNRHRDELGRAQRKLDEANALFTATKYPDAETAAVDSQTIAKTALATQPGHESDAQFLTVEGEVQFQKSSTNDWKKADVRTPLFNGDWVKTGDTASAELIFSNGSLYTIGSNALLEIYASMNPSTNRKQNAVQMQIGSVEIATTDDVSTVKTPGSQIVVDSESTTQVGIDKTARNTDVVTIKGSASVTASRGGPPVKVASGERVSASRDGGLSPVRKAAMPPGLISPSDNQVFQLSGNSTVSFSWTPQAGIAQYQLEVSRSRLFPTLEINARRPKPSAAAKVTSEGSFYWRVASISPDGEMGPFSQFRRFRVAGATSAAASEADKTPPSLVLKRPFNIGGQFYMIEGKTDPGATVFINDEEVDVDSDGTFKKLVSFDKIGRNAVVVKAVSPAGVQNIQSENVFVEE